MICGTPTPKQKQRLYWRMEMNMAKRAMNLYPVGSDEREIYRAKYVQAVTRYNALFDDIYRR